MPEVKNRYTGAVFTVPAGHHSLSNPAEYEVLSLTDSVVEEAEKEPTDDSFLAELENATEEEVDAFILDQGVDIGRAKTLEGKKQKIIGHLGL